MKLTNPEKLILIMLSDIHEKLGIDNVDTKLITNAIYSQNTWALSWELQGIVGDSPDTTPQEVIDVVDILDMWQFIEEAYETFDASEKTKIETETQRKNVKFIGFDGNNETEYMSIARFLVEDMGRFSRFKNRELNSHCPLIQKYRQMFIVFEQMRKTLDDNNYCLTVNQVIELLNTKRI